MVELYENGKKYYLIEGEWQEATPEVEILASFYRERQEIDEQEEYNNFFYF